MVNSWIAALQEFNKDRDRYMLPKKGSPEYAQVRALQLKYKKAPAPIPSPRRPKKAKEEKEL